MADPTKYIHIFFFERRDLGYYNNKWQKVWHEVHNISIIISMAGGAIVHLRPSLYGTANLFLTWLGKVPEMLNIVNTNQCPFP